MNNLNVIKKKIELLEQKKLNSNKIGNLFIKELSRVIL